MEKQLQVWALYTGSAPTYMFRFSNDVLNIKILLLTEKRIEKEIEVTFDFQQ